MNNLYWAMTYTCQASPLYLMWIISFPQNNPLRLKPLLSLFYRWGNQRSKSRVTSLCRRATEQWPGSQRLSLSPVNLGTYRYFWCQLLTPAHEGMIKPISDRDKEMWPVRSQSSCTFSQPRLKDWASITSRYRRFYIFLKVEMLGELNCMNAQFPAQTSACKYVWVSGGCAQIP